MKIGSHLPLSSVSRLQPAPRPASAPEPTDGYVAGESAPLRSTSAPAARKSPKELGYMWEGVAVDGIAGAVLRAVVGFGPIPGWLGLEPPPERDPVVKPLGFSWNGAPDFARRCSGLEKALETGHEVGKKRLGGGGNVSYLVELDTGVCGVWKPKRGQRASRPQLGKVDEGKREAAAYTVDRFLGHLARVPCASAHGFHGREGTFALFVPDGRPAKEMPDKEQVLQSMSGDDYRRIAIFDHVIGNLDRNDGNWLLDNAGHPIPIDHGLSFPLKNEKQGKFCFDFNQELTLKSEEKALLRGFLDRRQEVAASLDGLVEKEAVTAMFERVERMLAEGRLSHWWRAE